MLATHYALPSPPIAARGGHAYALSGLRRVGVSSSVRPIVETETGASTIARLPKPSKGCRVVRVTEPLSRADRRRHLAPIVMTTYFCSHGLTGYDS